MGEREQGESGTYLIKNFGAAKAARKKNNDMETNEVNKEIIGRRCECIFTGSVVRGTVREIGDDRYIPEEVVPAYETLVVTFGESIGRLDMIFDDPRAWGVATLKQWIDGYETTRFTKIDDRTAVVTSEYNMNHVKEWLEKNTPIINHEKR